MLIKKIQITICRFWSVTYALLHDIIISLLFIPDTNSIAICIEFTQINQYKYDLNRVLNPLYKKNMK